MFLHDLPTNSLTFAITAHAAVNHLRKYTFDPYSVHLVRVAALTRRFSNGDPILEAAANTHDYREDVVKMAKRLGLPKWTDELLLESFGPVVYDLVTELTDVYTVDNFPDWNRARRKSAEADRLADVSDGAKLIKLCDLFDNSSDIAINDPKFAVTYFKEKREILDRMGGGPPELRALVESAIPS